MKLLSGHTLCKYANVAQFKNGRNHYSSLLTRTMSSGTDQTGRRINRQPFSQASSRAEQIAASRTVNLILQSSLPSFTLAVCCCMALARFIRIVQPAFDLLQSSRNSVTPDICRVAEEQPKVYGSRGSVAVGQGRARAAKGHVVLVSRDRYVTIKWRDLSGSMDAYTFR